VRPHIRPLSQLVLVLSVLQDCLRTTPSAHPKLRVRNIMFSFIADALT
jgi:hypothetical protein